MDVVCPFICVHGLEIHHMTDHMILITYTISWVTRNM